MLGDQRFGRSLTTTSQRARKKRGEEVRHQLTLSQDGLKLVIRDDSLPSSLIVQFRDDFSSLLPRFHSVAQIPLPFVPRSDLFFQSSRKPPCQCCPLSYGYILPHLPDTSLSDHTGTFNLTTWYLPNDIYCLPEALQQSPIQAPKWIQLVHHDIRNLVWVLAHVHTKVANIGQGGDSGEEFYFGKRFREEEE